MAALPEAMRVLTSPADTGTVTLALPQDVQAEAADFPAALFDDRVWAVPRARGDAEALARAAGAIRASGAPVIIAGGGVHYSDAAAILQRFAEAFGIPVAETQAGRGALPSEHPLALGAAGVTGTAAANRALGDADLVISIGCRLTDFTTASRTAFQHPRVRFVGINVAEMDAFKHSAITVVADARAALEQLEVRLRGYQTPGEYRDRVAAAVAAWSEEVDRLTAPAAGPLMSQADVIGTVNRVSGPRDVVVCAAGSLPGELHKLWRTRDSKGYHVEYGYSCMGYEIAGGLGVKMADPSREVYVMVGDGSYLMMAQEIVTSIQEGVKLTIVLVDSNGFASIGSLSRSVGSGGFGTNYRYRSPESGALDGEPLPVDLAANAASLGAVVFHASNRATLEEALTQARDVDRTAVVYVPVDPLARVPGHGCWWDVPVAEVSEQPAVRRARAEYEEARKRQRWL